MMRKVSDQDPKEELLLSSSVSTAMNGSTEMNGNTLYLNHGTPP